MERPTYTLCQKRTFHRIQLCQAQQGAVLEQQAQREQVHLQGQASDASGADLSKEPKKPHRVQVCHAQQDAVLGQQAQREQMLDLGQASDAGVQHAVKGDRVGLSLVMGLRKPHRVQMCQAQQDAVLLPRTAGSA